MTKNIDRGPGINAAKVGDPPDQTRQSSGSQNLETKTGVNMMIGVEETTIEAEIETTIETIESITETRREGAGPDKSMIGTGSHTKKTKSTPMISRCLCKSRCQTKCLQFQAKAEKGKGQDLLSTTIDETKTTTRGSFGTPFPGSRDWPTCQTWVPLL